MAEHKLSKFQEAELAIFKEFVDICQENNLKYYICGGSFLGAVRHKGFIPWDDDIDVAMPRPDFEKFLEISPRLLSDDLYLSTYKLREDHITLVAMIINKHKDFTLNNSAKQVRTGAWVDILVIDGAPEPGLKRKIFGIKYMYYRMINQFAHFDEIVNLNTDTEFVFFPIRYVKRVLISHSPLYYYRVGVSDQSTSYLGIRKHFNDHLRVLWNIYDLYDSMNDKEEMCREWTYYRLKTEVANQYRYFCMLDMNFENWKRLKNFEFKLKENGILYKDVCKYSRFVRVLSYSKLLLYPLCCLWLEKKCQADQGGGKA